MTLFPRETEERRAPDERHGRYRPPCSSGKFGWRSKSLAKRHLKRRQAAGSTVRSLYKCPECGYWHMTSLGRVAER